MQISKIGIDLAKNIFQVHAADPEGRKVINKAMKPKSFKKWLVNLPSCTVGMEASSGSHYMARFVMSLGHKACLIAPQFVKPYVKSNKNDSKDAEAIVEAISRPSMRYVAIKETWQQDILSLHTVRSRLVRNRTSVINEARALAYEYGVSLSKGVARFRKDFLESVSSSEDVSNVMKSLTTDLYQEVCELDERILKIEKKLDFYFHNLKGCQRISKVEGIGVLTATALMAIIGDPKAFKNGREFSAFLGLVPKQNSSGGKNRLQGISKRGSTYLRTLLIHGGRAVVIRVKDKKDKRSEWIQRLVKEKGFPKASVAVANKNARICWALLAKEEDYIRS